MDIGAYLRSPELWVGSIIVGLLMNVVASYAKQHLDKRLAEYSTKRREQRRAQDEESARRIAEMVTVPELLMLCKQRELRFRLNALMALVLAVGVMLVGTQLETHGGVIGTLVAVLMAAGVGGILVTALTYSVQFASEHDAALGVLADERRKNKNICP